MSAPITIEKYNPKWPELFERERLLLEKTLGVLAVQIEHIGSTAVPGLGAKPIIDIMLGIENFKDADKCIALLSSIGYLYDTKRREDFPERKSLDKIIEGTTIYLYIVEIKTDFWKRHINFRDYLRQHPEIAKEYNKLKLNLAKKYRDDREAYNRGKSKFITKVEEEARLEYG
ncbi:MAG: GrpB family protein [Asgard group archaeon]|nr:GrpB family protein [Asgard group archaeon]